MDLMQILNGLAPAPDPSWTKPLPVPPDGRTSYLYPIFIILGFVVAIVGSCMKMWKRYKISVEPFYWFILIGVPISILGANFGSCVLGHPAGKDWSEFFTSFGTGLAIEWGVLFCFIAGCIYFPLILKLPRYRVRDEFGPKPEVKKVSMWLYIDAIMPCVLIAQAIGRWGNYFNQEVFGADVTSESLSWFLHNCLPGMYIHGSWKQPLFLWESLFNVGGFLLLYVAAEFLKVRKTGDIGAAYFVWYGVLRFCLEPLRDTDFKSQATMNMSIVYIALGAAFIVANHLFVARARDKKALKLTFSSQGWVFIKTLAKPIIWIQIKHTEWRIRVLNKQYSKKNKPKTKIKIEKSTVKLAKYKTENDPKYIEDRYIRTEQQKIYFGRW